MAIELKRARPGVHVVTLQFELTEEGLASFNDDMCAWIADNCDGFVVGFVESPERKAAVTNLMDDREEPGPAEFVTEVRHVDGAAPAGGRDARFDEPAWYDRVEAGADRAGRFAPVKKD